MSSEGKFTKGPWKAHRLASYTEPGWVILWPDTSKPGIHHRRLDYQGNFTEADARLLAASREMFDALLLSFHALEAISNEMTVGERYTNAGQHLLDALEPARMALAKALGQ